MNTTEKMSLLAELFETEPEDLKPEMKLDETGMWDSMTKLSLIVLMNEECGKRPKPEDIKTFETIGDILDYMG